MVKLKNVYPSAVNKLGVKVEEGMKITRLLYSDKTPFTVVGMSKSGNTLIIQEDGYDETTFNYETGKAQPVRNTEGEKIEVKLTKDSEGVVYKNHFDYILGEWTYLQDTRF